MFITVKTKEGRIREYIDAFHDIAPQVRLEEGCIEYEILQDSSDPRFDNEVRPDTIVLSEKWESIEALQRHSKGSLPLMKFRETVKLLKQNSSYVLLTPLLPQR